MTEKDRKTLEDSLGFCYRLNDAIKKALDLTVYEDIVGFAENIKDNTGKIREIQKFHADNARDAIMELGSLDDNKELLTDLYDIMSEIIK